MALQVCLTSCQLVCFEDTEFPASHSDRAMMASCKPEGMEKYAFVPLETYDAMDKCKLFLNTPLHVSCDQFGGTKGVAVPWSDRIGELRPDMFELSTENYLKVQSQLPAAQTSCTAIMPLSAPILESPTTQSLRRPAEEDAGAAVSRRRGVSNMGSGRHVAVLKVGLV